MVEWTDLKVTLPQDLSHPIEIDALPKPFSLPQSWDRPTAALHAYITGRVSRWHEMQLNTQQIVSHLVHLFQHAKEDGKPDIFVGVCTLCGTVSTFPLFKFFVIFCGLPRGSRKRLAQRQWRQRAGGDSVFLLA